MDKRSKISYFILSLSLSGMFICLCYFLRGAVLGCHDSLADFVYARTETVAQSYKRAMDFCLARGRVGFIFPAVVTLRQLINGHGSYAAVWLLQHLPIMIDVCLVSFIAGRKTSPVYGMFYGMCFMGFLQVNVWHSLIDCYPLDFMYGFALSVLGLYFFQNFLDKKGGRLPVILSIFFYYESMQAYEPFLFVCFVYAWLALASAGKSATPIKSFVRSLIPHFAASVVFLAILIYLHIHPAVVQDVTPINRYGSVGGFLKTWYTFSAGMFPLTHIRNVGFSAWLFTPDSIREHPLFVLFATAAMVTSVLLIHGTYLKADGKKRKAVDRALIVLGISGLIYAVFFPMSHALTENYQKWVTEGEAGAYVPTAISYFGWILFLSAVACFVVNKVAASGRKSLKIAATVFAGAAFFFGSHFTAVINEYFRDEYASTGASVTAKAMAFNDMIEDLSDDGVRYDVIYVPDYAGINGDIELNEVYAESVLGYDVEIINDREELEMYNDGQSVIAEFAYDEDSREGEIVAAR